jgi:hypothetical protein
LAGLSRPARRPDNSAVVDVVQLRFGLMEGYPVDSLAADASAFALAQVLSLRPRDISEAALQTGSRSNWDDATDLLKAALCDETRDASRPSGAARLSA